MKFKLFYYLDGVLIGPPGSRSCNLSLIYNFILQFDLIEYINKTSLYRWA